jgi:glycosyltransferase involved in cell wall biosynthesis
MRYWFALADWLKSNHEAYDIVCVSGLQYDGYSASQALALLSHPLVLRAEAAGPAGDCQWQATARFGSRVRQRCQQASAIIATSESIATELIEAEYEATQISIIPNGMEALPYASRNVAERRAARVTLAGAHASLRAPKLAKIALCVEPIHATEQLPPLLSWWKRVVEHTPQTQLWLIGQGRTYDIVPRLAERCGLELAVAAPGMFDDLMELYQAADLLLMPFDSGGQSVAALEAMAVGLPVIARDTPGNRMVLADGKLGTVVDFEAEHAGEEVAGLMADLSQLEPQAMQAHEHVVQHRSLRQMGEEHLALFARLLDTESTIS